MEDRIFMPAEFLALAGVSRDEASQWNRAGLINVPPADPAAGRARRYSRANVIEMALFKALVSEGYVRIPHIVAKRVLKRRLEMALVGRGLSVRDNVNPLKSPERFNQPGALAQTEFDLATHRRRRPNARAPHGLRHELWIIANDDDESSDVGAMAGLVFSTWDAADAWTLDIATAVQAEARGKAITFSLTKALKDIERRARAAGVEPQMEPGGSR